MGDAGIYFYWSLRLLPQSKPIAALCFPLGKLWASLGFLRSISRVNEYLWVPSFTLTLIRNPSITAKCIYFLELPIILVQCSRYRCSPSYFVLFTHTILNRLRIYVLKFIFQRIRALAMISFSLTKDLTCIHPTSVLFPDVIWYRNCFC